MQSYHGFKRAIALLIVVAVGMLLAGPQTKAQEPADTGVSAAGVQAELGANIPYQGQLTDNGAPANGTYDFQFKLFDDASAGNQVGGEVNREDVAVATGLFAVELDFGTGAFNGEARYLEIGVRPGASTGAYTPLSPRRPLLASPYAQYSNATRGLNVDGSGNVSIGTDNPTQRLDIVTSTGGASNHLIGFRTTAANGQGSLFGVDTANRSMYRRLNTSGDYRWQFQNAQGETVFSILNSGELAAYQNIEIDINHAIGVSGIGAFSFPHAGHTMGGHALGWFRPNNEGRGQMWLSGQDGMQFFTDGKSRMGVAADGTVGIYGNFGVDGTTTTKDLHVDGSLRIEDTTTTKVLQITGGADLAEPFVVVDRSPVEPGTVVVLDTDNPGQLRASDAAYDTLVAGIVSGAGGINPGLIMQQESAAIDGETHPIALIGKVYVKAVGPIKVGDLLTTADIPGHAMAATDRERAFGATLGKAMSPLADKTGLVLVLVALQ